MTIQALATQGRDRISTGLAGIDTDKLKQLRSNQMKAVFGHFAEIPYRMQFVARIHGMAFVNDAASQSVNATWYAMESSEKSLIWIANANTMPVDYSRLESIAARKVRKLICVGDPNCQLVKAMTGIIPQIESTWTLGQAATRALYSGLENVSVLYSPACENGVPVEQLGAIFEREVNEL